MPNSNSAAVRPQTTCLRDQSENHGIHETRDGSTSSTGLPALPTSRSSSQAVPASPASIESLEPRQLLSMSIGSDGWTVVNPGPGARVVYVSSSQGSDGNSGLSANAPVKSLARGEKLLRNGAGDQLLLKRGDTWHESFGFWGISGKSSSEPVVIGAYGSGNRPTIASGNNTGWSNGLTSVHDIAFIGVHFDASGRSGGTPDGIQSSGRLSNVLVEDCEIEGYRNNLTFQSFWSPISNVRVRRNVITDSYSKGTHSQGIYADGVRGVSLEENIFDHNGRGHGAGATMFNHAAYITAESSGLVARGNVFANSSAYGLQARPGGIVEDNLFYNNATGLSFGLVNGGGPTKAGGVSGRVDNNVFMGGHNISGLAAGVGMEISNTTSAQVTDNVFAYGANTDNAAIVLGVGSSSVNGGSAVGINNLTVANNVIYHWSRGINVSGSLHPGSHGASGLNNLVVRNNDIQAITSYQAVMHFAAFSASAEHWSGNRYDVPGNSKTPLTLGSRGLSLSGWKAYESSSQWTRVSYPAAGRNLNSYAPDFLAKARGLSKQNWDTKYLAAAAVSYIRAGFKGGSGATGPDIPVISVPDTPAVKGGSGGSSSGSSGKSAGPSVTIGDTRTTEGKSGKHSVTFQVRLSRASSQKVTVSWETKGQTASVTQDYVGQHGTLVFQPGQTVKTISIAVKGDKTREKDETFVINLLGATNAKITDGQGVCTIVNDD